MWELSGKACAKCSETRYHLAARPPEGEECCVAACGRVRVCTCAVCVCTLEKLPWLWWGRRVLILKDTAFQWERGPYVHILLH